VTYPKWCLSFVAVIVLCVTVAWGSNSSTAMGASLAMVSSNSSTSTSFTQFIQSVNDAHYSDYVHLSATKVESEQAFEKMRLAILKMYAGVRVVSTYMESGQPIDCTVTSTQFSHPSSIGIARSEASHLKDASSTLPSACREGTIPVIRMTLDTLVRFPTLQDFLSSMKVAPPLPH
jgi:hypothetical protein